MDLPLLVTGDANVWHPEFSLGRSRSQDDLIVPLVDLLVSSCGFALINPRDQATHDAGAALDLVFVSADCPSTLRIHDGIGCCVVRRVHPVELQNDSRRPHVGSLICEIGRQLSFEPTSISANGAVMSVPDWMALFHVLSQVMKLWWTSCTRSSWPFCLGTLHVSNVLPNALNFHGGPHVARNGTWCDCQRVHTLEAPSRFRVARTTFHRTVRSAQGSFWSHWQERVASLVLPFPPFNALHNTVASRSDPVCALSQHEILDGWRTHFQRQFTWFHVGFDAFFQSISAWFDAVVSSPTSPGLFDASFY